MMVSMIYDTGVTSTSQFSNKLRKENQNISSARHSLCCTLLTSHVMFDNISPIVLQMIMERSEMIQSVE